MNGQSSDEHLIEFLREIIVSIVDGDEPDLTARQLSVFLICYLQNEEQTVRGLASNLDVAKSAISCALDKLMELDLVVRVYDPMDKRSILVRRTRRGDVFLEKLHVTVKGAMGVVKKRVKNRKRVCRSQARPAVSIITN